MSRKKTSQQKDKRINQIASRNVAMNLYLNLGDMFMDLNKSSLVNKAIFTLDKTEQWAGLATALSEEMQKQVQDE